MGGGGGGSVGRGVFHFLRPRGQEFIYIQKHFTLGAIFFPGLLAPTIQKVRDNR